MVANLSKTVQSPRPRAVARKAAKRPQRRPAHRRLLDLYGVELYAVISYRLALAVLATVAFIYATH